MGSWLINSIAGLRVILSRMGMLSVCACAVLAAAAAVADPLRVACVGDSITYGYGIDDREMNSYPAQLGALLGDHWTVGNFGRNGATALKNGTVSYWDQIQYTSALKFSPDIVIIMLGTNDSRDRDWPDHSGEFVSDYVDLIQRFQNLESRPTVYICYSAPLYVGDDGHPQGFRESRIRDEVLPKVDEIAAQTGVPIINIYSALSGRPNLFSDMIHPTAEGAGIMASVIAESIRHHSGKASGDGPGKTVSFDRDGDRAYGTRGYGFYANGIDVSSNTDGLSSDEQRGIKYQLPAT